MKDNSHNLFENVTDIASSLQTDVHDVSQYIRASLFNYLTSSQYRDIASDFYTIIKALSAEIEDETATKLKSKKAVKINQYLQYVYSLTAFAFS